MGYKFNDLTGKRIGKLTVIEQAGRDKNRRILWRCKCDCGNECLLSSNVLARGQSSCGCYRHARIRKDRTGERHGRLVVLGPANIKKRTENYWLCKCDCGNECVVSGSQLKKDGTKSCGCYQKETYGKHAITHGMTKTKLYKRWNSMKQRCQNPNEARYADYGGRGISVCEEWEDFEGFKKWAMENGYEEHLSIDRIDNDGDYCPENCRWVPMSVQAWNKRTTTRITYNGETHSLNGWSKKTGLPPSTIRARIDKRWDIKDALTVPWLERKERKNWKATH